MLKDFGGCYIIPGVRIIPFTRPDRKKRYLRIVFPTAVSKHLTRLAGSKVEVSFYDNDVLVYLGTATITKHDAKRLRVELPEPDALKRDDWHIETDVVLCPVREEDVKLGKTVFTWYLPFRAEHPFNVAAFTRVVESEVTSLGNLCPDVKLKFVPCFAELDIEITADGKTVKIPVVANDKKKLNAVLRALSLIGGGMSILEEHNINLYDHIKVYGYINFCVKVVESARSKNAQKPTHP